MIVESTMPGIALSQKDRLNKWDCGLQRETLIELTRLASHALIESPEYCETEKGYIVTWNQNNRIEKRGKR